jgi:threonine dehydratase
VNFQADSIIDRDYIAQTERLIRPHVRRTPIIEVDAADFGLAAARLSFKLELLQHAGSFKTRGAFANLLSREIPRAGGVKVDSRPLPEPLAKAALTPDGPLHVVSRQFAASKDLRVAERVLAHHANRRG